MFRPASASSIFVLVGLTGLASACGGSSPSSPAPNTPAADAGATAPPAGKTFPTAEAAPNYEGTSFAQAQIFDLESEVWLDETKLIEGLDDAKLVFMGEQHETAPAQELELWVLQRLTKRHPDVALAMEHFQHDEQPVIDDYLAGKISGADFEKKSDPWPNYATFWKPLVEHMKSEGRPVIGLNVPKEALNEIYGQYPKTPLTVFNAWGDSFKYASSIAPRPVAKWDATYKAYFETNFDYEVHGKQMGMTPAEALPYFTDLAHIRDETMAYFAAKALDTAGNGRVFVVAGDWHVQTGLATPDRAARYRGGADAFQLVTTIPAAKFDELRAKTISGRKLARFVIVYQ